MSIFTRKLKASILILTIFCMTATACDLSSFAPNSQTTLSSSDIQSSSMEESIESSSQEDSSWDESSSSEETSSTENSSSYEESSSPEDSTKEEQTAAEKIMDEAYALSTGSALQGVYQLSGTISQIDVKYTVKKGVCLYFDVDEPKSRELYCYRLKGEGADLIGVGDSITVSGTLKNYKGTIEFDACTLVAYTLVDGTSSPDISNDPYKNVSEQEFYSNYTPATSNEDAYYRSLHGFMSGSLTVPDQAPTLSSYRPKHEGAYVRNQTTIYEENGDAYVVTDVYGNEAFTVYRAGGYITLEEVAAYVYAFGTYPKNYTTSKNTDPDDSIWDEYLRLNHTAFSGDTDDYPYEPVLPNITGCGGKLRYYEMDIGTTGTDCSPEYPVKVYNDGNTITRGAARIVYGKTDIDKDGVFEDGEWHVFYTYNHYNDFQEYLNYAGGWGEKFGNITGGGTLSSEYHYNPTKYIPIYFGSLNPESTDAIFQRYFAS